MTCQHQANEPEWLLLAAEIPSVTFSGLKLHISLFRVEQSNRSQRRLDSHQYLLPGLVARCLNFELFLTFTTFNIAVVQPFSCSSILSDVCSHKSIFASIFPEWYSMAALLLFASVFEAVWAPRICWLSFDKEFIPAFICEMDPDSYLSRKMCVGLQIARAIWIGWFGLMWFAVNLPQLVNAYCMFALWLGLVPAAMQELRCMNGCVWIAPITTLRCSNTPHFSAAAQRLQNVPSTKTHTQTSPQPTHTYTHLPPTDIWHALISHSAYKYHRRSGTFFFFFLLAGKN